MKIKFWNSAFNECLTHHKQQGCRKQLMWWTSFCLVNFLVLRFLFTELDWFDWYQSIERTAYLYVHFYRFRTYILRIILSGGRTPQINHIASNEIQWEITWLRKKIIEYYQMVELNAIITMLFSEDVFIVFKWSKIHVKQLSE